VERAGDAVDWLDLRRHRRDEPVDERGTDGDGDDCDSQQDTAAAHASTVPGARGLHEACNIERYARSVDSVA
jgi:hypothetical protein